MNPVVLAVLGWHLLLTRLIFGFSPRFLSGKRTSAQQLALFRTASTRTNPVAFPGTSQHEFGFAYDLAPDVRPGQAGYDFKLGQLRDLGLALGMRWGGNADPQHWQAFPRQIWDAILGGFSGEQPPGSMIL